MARVAVVYRSDILGVERRRGTRNSNRVGKERVEIQKKSRSRRTEPKLSWDQVTCRGLACRGPRHPLLKEVWEYRRKQNPLTVVGSYFGGKL
jgi:hypothetical protein